MVNTRVANVTRTLPRPPRDRRIVPTHLIPRHRFSLFSLITTNASKTSHENDAYGIHPSSSSSPAATAAAADDDNRYNANVAFALGSLAKVSVPTYNTLKRMTPAIVLIANRVFRLKPDPSRSVVLTITVVIFGCLVAGYGDLEFDPLGYVMGLTSCMLQASYMICVEKTGAERGVSSVELMVYNALLSAPPLAGIVFFTGEFGSGMGRVAESIAVRDTGFIVTLVAALLAGMLLNYALFLCTLTNSALTTTVVG